MNIQIKSYCQIKSGKAYLNGDLFFESPNTIENDLHQFGTDLYTQLVIDYRKFFKMDLLSKFGFLASELVLKEFDKTQPKEDMGIILFNKSSSLEADESYQETIQDEENYYPSPSVFVYTLPNIVTGEIAIRNKIHGETTFYVMPCFNSQQISQIITDSIHYSGLQQVLAGWTEIYQNNIDFRLMLCQINNEANLLLSKENIDKLFRNIN